VRGRELSVLKDHQRKARNRYSQVITNGNLLPQFSRHLNRKPNIMTKNYVIPTFFFIIISLLFFISGCSKSIDTQTQELDLSKITATGTEGPQDFIGTIDTSDWSPSYYDAIVFGKSFWIQKPTLSDTLFFGGRLAGDTDSQSLRIYNSGGTTLSITSHLQGPFFLGSDSLQIQPASLGMISIYFILPDTTNVVHSGTLLLNCSTGDSVKLKLQGNHTPSGGGGPVDVGTPVNFSFPPAYPNPTNGPITFEFSVPQTINALLKVVNKESELVTVLAQDNYVSGVHILNWNVNLANGNYRVIFQAGSYVAHGDIKISR
jgi:hypothetical protein